MFTSQINKINKFIREKKYYTFIIVPQKADKVKKYRFSHIQVLLILSVVGILLLSSLAMMFSFIGFQLEKAELNRLRKENRKMSEDLVMLNSQMEDLKDHLDKIRQFDEKLRIITNITEFTEGEEMFGVGGPLPEGGESVTELDKRRDNLIKEMKIDLDQLEEESKLQEESLQELLSFLEDQKNLLASTPSIWPSRGFITSGFGYRRSPYTKTLRMHEGIDIANRSGTPIYAPADGIVIFAGIEGGYGKFLAVDHGYGIVTRYGHLDTILVKEGERVNRNTKLGNIGCSGRCTGPHLHYEVRVNGVPVNPRNYILN